LKDVDEAIIKAKRQDVPLVLMGHSMGGGIVLNYVARKDQYKGYKLLTAVIASAPLVTLSMPIPAIKYYPLKGLSKVLPSFTIRAGLDPSGISHDKEEVEIYKNDPLVHDFATLATGKTNKPKSNIITLLVLLIRLYLFSEWIFRCWK
jgi:acylglycerol lipase